MKDRKDQEPESTDSPKAQKYAARKRKFITYLPLIIIVFLVVTLLILGQRTCTIYFEGDMESGAVWKEMANDGKTVMLTDQGYTREDEYVIKYRTAANNASSVVVFAFVDTETGDVVGKRVAYRISTNFLGFIRVEKTDVPAGVPVEATQPETDGSTKEPGIVAGLS